MGPSATQSLPLSAQCSPIIVEYQLMKEFVLFQKQNFPHVYLVPSHSSPFVWFGIMFVHSGIYSGKILRFTLYINTSYPNCDVPTIAFDPIPIHPFINQNTGELDTSFYFTKWNASNNSIFEIIQYAKAVFEIDDINDLSKLTNNQMSNFSYDTNGLKALVTEKMNTFNEEVTKKSGDDKNFITFTEPENPSVIDKLRRQLLTDKVSNEDSLFGNNVYKTSHMNSPSISGLSWVKNIAYK